MKTLDLKRTPSFMLARTIKSYCGGERPATTFADRFRKGMGGFIFRDEAAGNQPYRSILALYQNGLGIYCRNVFSNYLVLIPADDILNIEIIKKADVIKTRKISLYSILKKTGLKHHQITGYLMPAEWERFEPATCTIRTNSSYFTLYLEKCAPEYLLDYFRHSPVSDKIIHRIYSPEFR